MPTASAQKYGAGLALNISSMTTDAPNLHDGSANDTSTYYNNSAGSGAVAGAGMCAYIDLGSAQAVDEAKFTIWANGDISSKYSLHWSDDGSSWTAVNSDLTFTGDGAFHSQDKSFSSVSHRYWRLQVKTTTSDNSTAWETRISDFRLFTGGSEYTYTVTTTKTQSGKARITATTTQTQAGKARVTATTTKTQPGKARITATTTKTQPGVARITGTTTKTQAGVARIQITTTRTQAGVARIQILTTRTQPGLARITAVTAKTQTGVSRITATTTRTISGVASITSISSQPGYGIPSGAQIPGGTLVPSTVIISSRSINPVSVVPGGVLSFSIVSVGIPPQSVVPSGVMFFDSIIISSLGVPPQSRVPGGTITPGVHIISSHSFGPMSQIPGGSLGGGTTTIVSFGFVADRRVPGGSISIIKDVCARPFMELSPTLAGLSSFDLAQMSGLDQSLFDAFLNQVPTAKLKKNATAVAIALGLEPSQLKSQIAKAERQYIGRTAAPVATVYKSLKKR